MSASIKAVSYFLPDGSLTNEQISSEHPDWKMKRITATTGILNRPIAGKDVFTSDLAAGAARKLFAEHDISPESVEYIILCTQSADYYLPTTACIVQQAIGVSSAAGALDINLGCSGFIYGLALARGLIESGQVRNVLLITAETHSKFANPDDKSTRPIFGDAAAATFVADDSKEVAFHGTTLGSDGSGAAGLVVPNGRLRPGLSLEPRSSTQVRGLTSNGYDMYMDGMEIFNFTLRVVPGCVESVLAKAGVELSDVDLFIFHQANLYMIEHLRKKLMIPEDKFVVALENYGNTGSSTIPIALAESAASGRLKRGDRVMLVGFGVGLSWGGVLVTW